MSRSDTHRVADMLMAAAEIGDVTARGRAAFDTDVTLRRAVERCLEALGEAAKAVSTDLRDQHARSAVGRNGQDPRPAQPPLPPH